MYLFVFYEFCRPDLLEKVKQLCPNLTLNQSTIPLKDKYQDIYRTNAKIFYNDALEVSQVLEVLKSIGFVIVDIPPIIYKEKRTIYIEDEKAKPIYKKCECGNDIKVPQMIKKIIIVDVPYYYNDRIILKVPQVAGLPLEDL